MTLQLNTEFLLRYKLTANQFMLLCILKEDSQFILRKLVNAFPEYENDLKLLAERGYIQKTGKVTYMITENGKIVFDQDSLFEEFAEIYPGVITRPDGTRDFLKTDLKRCKAAYDKVVNGDIEKHNMILRSLAEEIKVRREKANGMSYMRKMYNWIKSEGWIAYDGTTSNSENNTGIVEIFNYGADELE